MSDPGRPSALALKIRPLAVAFFQGGMAKGSERRDEAAMHMTVHDHTAAQACIKRNGACVCDIMLFSRWNDTFKSLCSDFLITSILKWVSLIAPLNCTIFHSIHFRSWTFIFVI